MGHQVKGPVREAIRSTFGRGAIIRRSKEGILWGGCDPRGDGMALGW